MLFGIALSVWSANGGMKHIFDALNLVYNEREKRNFFVLNLISLAFTAGALLFLILALGAVVVLPVVFEFIGIGKDAWWLALLRWPVLLLAVLGGLAVLYRYGPSRARRRGTGSPGERRGGGSLARRLVAVLVVRRPLRQLQQDLRFAGGGDRVHDVDLDLDDHRIAVAPGECRDGHQTAEDTTVGEPKSLGTRGAKMADTVGAAAE